MIRKLGRGAWMAFLILSPLWLAADEFDEQFKLWPIDLKINGRIVASGGLTDVSVLKDAFRRIPEPTKVTLLVDANAESSTTDPYANLFAPAKVESTDAEPATSIRIMRLDKNIAEQIRSGLSDCEVFCWHMTGACDEATRLAMHECRGAFQQHLAGGGAIVFIGKHAGMLGAQDVAASNGTAVSIDGLGLIPDVIVDAQYDGTADERGQLLSRLAIQPRRVGVGIGSETAIVLNGRLVRAIGKEGATFLLMANDRLPVRVQTIAVQSASRQSPEDFMVDLTEWRRDAIDRTLPPFPPLERQTPNVICGSLVIVGGGGMPKGLMDRFVELAGGVEKARLVYVPCEEADEVPSTQGTVESWKKMGVQHATFIHTKDRNKANSDEEFLAPLRDATGIWYGGGRQWNLADSYYGTKAHRLMLQIVERGGVAGGSSAGASIQGEYLARATPIGNFRIMAPGYERGGLAFLTGVAIDQHFTQRGRHKDLTQLVNRYPHLLGIGLDEATAIVVRGSTAEVVGRGKAHFYDRDQPVYPDRPDFVALPDGSKYDLATRQVLLDASEAKAPAAESTAAPR